MNSQVEMRSVYAETLVELGQEDERIVLLEADLMRAHSTQCFRERFPERSINVGVAEANMVGIASGLSATGKKPFATTFACFAARRAYDQFFVSANYSRLNVNLVGTTPGITAELNGGTHMALEDVSLMRAIPHLVVFEPSDPVCLRRLVRRAASHEGCTYMRLHLGPTDELYDPTEDFEFGESKVLHSGRDVALIATGVVMVREALEAAELLSSRGLSATVVDMHTIKPIDRNRIIEVAASCGAIVTCENHQIVGGLGSAVAEVLGEEMPTPMARVGVNGEFGEVGPVNYLRERFGVTAAAICERAQEVVERKGR